MRGTLWVAARLLEAGLLLPERAWEALERMKANGRRLPWDRARALCQQR